MKLSFDRKDFLQKKPILISLFWGCFIGVFTGIITILGHYDNFLSRFNLPQGGLSFYSIKILPMLTVIYFIKEENFFRRIFISLLLTISISLFSEITLNGYFQLNNSSQNVTTLIFFHNLKILSISSIFICIIMQFIQTKTTNYDHSVIDSEQKE